MEIKEWSYEEFPEFTEPVEGAKLIETTGDEVGIWYIRDVEYAVMGDAKLHLEILRPHTRNQPEQVFPCVVFVQGSAWMPQCIYAQIPMMASLVKKGYVVAYVEYRHSGIAAFPAQAVDTKNAIRFLRLHAAEYFIDADRMIVAGDSSGGHTAVFSALINNDGKEDDLYPGVSSEVKGVVDFYGCVNAMMEDAFPSTVNHHLPDSPEGMVMGGVNLKERPDLCRQLTAEYSITEDTPLVPVLIVHGTKDRTVNIRQSISLYEHLKAKGKDAELCLVKGADHGGPEFWTEEMVQIVDEFIQKCFQG